jgi:hypothetical protein
MNGDPIGNSLTPHTFQGSGVLAVIAALLIYFAPVSQPAESTLITFEELPAGSTVTTQFGPRGVVFQSAFVGTDFGARSGTRALRSVPPTAEVFNPVPIVMSFTSPQARVSLFAMSPGIARNGTFQGFDANGNVVAQDGPKQVAANAFTAKFEVKSNNPRIVRAVFQLENAGHYAIDDLEFQGEAAQPPPPPPQVVITSPANGAQLDVETLAIAGTVNGQGLVSNVTATIEFGRPPDRPYHHSHPFFRWWEREQRVNSACLTLPARRLVQLKSRSLRRTSPA